MGTWRRASAGGPPGFYVTLRAWAKSCQRAKISARAALKSGNGFAAPLMALSLLAYGVCRLAVAMAGAVVALGCPRVDVNPGDRLLLPEPPYRNHAAIEAARLDGVRIIPLIHDLHAITHPHVLEGGEKLRSWIIWACEHASAILCVSLHTENEVRRVFSPRGRTIGHFHLGFDAFTPPAPHRSLGVPAPFFLMVGTLAPNKRHRDVLDALDLLWAEGSSANLVIIGRLGWLTDDLCSRLRSHPRRNQNLFWLDDAGDAELAAAYHSAHALVAASECEGFGLPVVEALARGTPVIASDIPPFREVAGAWADYFPMGDVPALAALLRVRAAAPRRAIEAFPGRSWDKAAQDALRFAADS